MLETERILLLCLLIEVYSAYTGLLKIIAKLENVLKVKKNMTGKV
jgi:hypothetical protein